MRLKVYLSLFVVISSPPSAEPPMMAPAPLQAPDRAEVQSLSTKRVVKDLMLSYGAQSLMGCS
jgi:hypothetical protein